MKKTVVTPSEKQLIEFSKRLNDALDGEGIAKKYEGRQTSLKSMMSVSQNAARKWLEGEGMPDTKKLTKLCKILNVEMAWLVSGVGEMRPVSTNASVANNELSELSRVAQSIVREIIKVDKACGGIPQTYGKIMKEVLQTVKGTAKKR